MEVYNEFEARAVALATWAILQRGSLLCVAFVLNTVPQLLVSVFAGHLS